MCDILFALCFVELTMATGSDPHFSVRLSSGHMLCFSVKGEAGSNFNLISTEELEINAQFITLSNRPGKTWLGTIGVAFAKRELVFNSSSRNLQIDNKIALEVTRVEKVRITARKFYLTMTDNLLNKEIEVDIEEPGVNVKFSVVFVKREHLDLLWLSGTVDMESIHGLLGQFLRPGVKLDEDKALIIFPGRETPQPMRQRKLFSFLHADAPQFFDKEQLCWTTKKPSQQGVGLIEGSYLDYKVDSITFNKFKLTIN